MGGPAWGEASFVLLALYCVLTTPAAQVQPVVGMTFPPELAGRALSAYNLVVFVGIFLVQWGIGLAVDGLRALGLGQAAAFQGAMGVFGALSVLSYLVFVWPRSR